MKEQAHAIDEETTQLDLEWTRIAWAVASRCRGPRAERRDVPIATTFEQTERALAETREALSLEQQGDEIPLDGICDIGPSIDRLERDGVLGAPSLRDLNLTLAAARRLRLFLARRRAMIPFLDKACATDPTLDHLADEIGFSISEDGTIVDDASPELKRLRTEVGNLRQRIVGKLEAMIHKHGAILQDGFYTVREGRYVLPLRADAHERFEGIVHGSSASGATLFVEPKQLVDRGNRLKMAQDELVREETKILAALSDLVRDRVPELRQVVEALDHADLKAASAHLANDLNGVVPDLAEGPVLALRQARHPILVLDGVKVVANDLRIDGAHALVLSGPNAGGKTVVLKTLGLAALMVRAGLPIAAGDGSVCGFFEPVLSALGDEQSLERSLSTFSAHVMRVSAILEESRPRVLVLLDELASGTEPHAGAALACAVTEELVNRGATVVVTTHYDEVKAFAAEHALMTNAAVGFDVDKMAPTFELMFGVPGASNALDVASRYKLPGSVIDRARAFLSDDARGFEALAAELRTATQNAEHRSTELETQRTALLRAQGLVAAKEARLEERERRRFSELGAQLARKIRDAEREIKQARRAIRDAKDDQAVAAAARRVSGASGVLGDVRDHAAPTPPPTLDDAPIEQGDRVWVQHLRCTADVIEGPVRDKVRVAAGMMRLWVDLTQVRKTNEPSSKEPARPTKKMNEPPRPTERSPLKEPTAAQPVAVRTPRTPHNTLDVRGLRADDAVAMTESFLDRMYGEAVQDAFILHGVGSGALRDAIQAHLLADTSYVAHFEQAGMSDGGAQVTVVRLR